MEKDFTEVSKTQSEFQTALHTNNNELSRLQAENEQKDQKIKKI